MERVGEIVHPELAARHPLARERDHPRALIEPHNRCSGLCELLGIQPGAARRVENALAGHVAEQTQAGRTVVVRVVEAVDRVVQELVGERLVLRRPPDLVAHAEDASTSRARVSRHSADSHRGTVQRHRLGRPASRVGPKDSFSSYTQK